MAKITLNWHEPFQIKLGFPIFVLENCSFDDIPSEPGVYVFSRKHGKKTIPVYIGKANNLQSRIKQEFNNAELLAGLKKKSGKKSILVATIKKHLV